MGVAYNPTFVTDMLSTYIDFANIKSSPKTGTSPVTIKDLSGYGKGDWTTYNDCTIGPTSVNMAGSQSYLYSTGNDWFNAWSPNSSNGIPQMSIELVFNSVDTGGLIVSRPWNGSGQYNYTMSDTGFGLYIGSSSASLSYSSICTGAKQHMVWWMDQTNFGVYKNGYSYVSATAHGLTGGGASSGTGAFGTCVGTLYPYGQSNWNIPGFCIAGDYYLFRIYRKVLQPTEVLQNFKATRGRFGL